MLSICFIVFPRWNEFAAFSQSHAIMIYYAMRDLIPFVQFKKRKKHPWRSVNFSKVAWVFFTFFKLYECYQIAQCITYAESFAWVFFTFFKLYECYQIAQCITYAESFKFLRIFLNKALPERKLCYFTKAAWPFNDKVISIPQISMNWTDTYEPSKAAL